MTADTMPEPDGPGDERFVYVVTAAGVEALRQSAAAFDSEQRIKSWASVPEFPRRSRLTLSSLMAEHGPHFPQTRIMSLGQRSRQPAPGADPK